MELEINTSINNGKALLQCKVHLQKTETDGTELVLSKETYLDIRVWDREDRLVLYCCHPLWQDELPKGLILHPHLWQGTEDPYLYRIRVSLMETEDITLDVLETTFALRTFCEIERKGWFLNEEPFQIRSVAYEIPTSDSISCMSDESTWKAQIYKDLELIRKMGANTLYPTGGSIDREFCRICDEVGLLLWGMEKTQSAEKLEGVTDMPRFRGAVDSLFMSQGDFPTDCYYFYKACWSKEPFVYISRESLSFQRNGHAQVTVYSNQKKVVLYVDGVLFEFRMEGPDFLFQEIPVKQLPLLLTAEAGECSMSITAYPYL